MLARRTGTVSALAFVAVAVLATEAWVGRDFQGGSRTAEDEAHLLEAQQLRLAREREASGRVAARVIAGTLPLAGAVDELEPMLRARDGFECEWIDDPPPTFRHRVARYVTVRVEAELAHDPVRRTAVLARLHAEYAALR